MMSWWFATLMQYLINEVTRIILHEPAICSAALAYGGHRFELNAPLTIIEGPQCCHLTVNCNIIPIGATVLDVALAERLVVPSRGEIVPLRAHGITAARTTGMTGSSEF